MTRQLISAAIAVALLSTTALAADLPSRRAPPVYVPPPLPAFTWTGLYVGAQVGYGFGRANGTAFNTGTGAAIVGGGGNPSGIIGGAHVGYLFSTQSLPAFGGIFGGGGVVGVEGDVDGSNVRTTYAIGPIANSVNRPIQGSIRGRLGVAVDRVLFYATGGAAFGDLRNTYTFNGVSDSFSRTRVGYTVGGGIEYAFTNNWSARVEYRYTDFGRSQDVLANSTQSGVTVRRRDNDNRVQAGISYRFDTFSAPVVARY